MATPNAQRESRSTLRILRERGPPQKSKWSSTQKAPTAVMCGRPSGSHVDNQNEW